MFGVSEYNPCDYHEGICEQKCSFNDTTNKVTCSCASGYGQDGTNCIPLDGGFVMLTSLDLDFTPPPPPPTGMHEHFKNENKIAQGNHLPDHNYYIFIHLNHSLIQQASFFFRNIDGEDLFLGGRLPGLVTVSVRPCRKLHPQTYSQLTRGTLHQDCGF